MQSDPFHLETALLKVEGMKAARDATAVCDALRVIGGVARVTATHDADTVRVEYDPGRVKPWQFRAAVRAVSCRVDSIALPGDPPVAAASVRRISAAA